MRATDPLLVPRANRELAAIAASDPERLRAAVGDAVERALAWFEGQGELEVSALTTLWLQRRAGFEPRLGFVVDRVERFRRRVNSPHLRLFYPDYDPQSPAVAHLPVPPISRDFPIEASMIQCLYADRLGLGPDFLSELGAIDDRGSYGTTHVVIGCLLLKDVSRIPHAAIDRLIASSVPSLLAAQRTSRAGDLFAERIMVLQWIGRHAEIEPAWILRLVRAQLADGGWPGRPTLRPGVSNQHTSALALSALVEYRARRCP